MRGLEMKLTSEEAREVVYDDHEDFETVKKEITDTSRWSIFYEGVFKHKPTEKLYWVSWSVGATEQQDERPFEYGGEVDFVEVKPVEVVKIEYVPV